MAPHNQKFIELFVYLLRKMSDGDIKHLLSVVFNTRQEHIINFLENVKDPSSRDYLLSMYSIDEKELVNNIQNDPKIVYYKKNFKTGYEMEISLEVDASMALRVEINSNLELARAISSITKLSVLIDDESISTNSWFKVDREGKVYKVFGYDEENYPGGWDEENSGIYLDETKTKLIGTPP